MTLPADEILRVLFHDLPEGFVRICHFGFLANCGRTAKLARCRALAVPPAVRGPCVPRVAAPQRAEERGGAPPAVPACLSDR